MQELGNKYGKTILYIIGGLLAIYLMIYFFTPKQEIPTEYKQALDSLTEVNKVLIEKQQELETAIENYELVLRSLDSEVKILEDKKTEINNYYGEAGKKVIKYTPTQVDSFFKARYNY